MIFRSLVPVFSPGSSNRVGRRFAATLVCALAVAVPAAARRLAGASRADNALVLHQLPSGAVVAGFAPAEPPPQSPAARDLLSAIVSRVLSGNPSSSVLIAERAVVTARLPLRSLPGCGTSEARERPTLPCGPSGFDSIPAGLLTGVTGADTASRRWHPNDMPDNAQLLPDTLRQTLLAAGPDGFWPAVRARFPTANLVTVSPLQITADGLAAAATVMMRCGRQCGYVVYSILERPTSTEPWRVTRWITALRF